MGKLTAKSVEKLVKGAASGLTSDGDGLYLKIGKSGSGASWVFRYKIDSKSRYMGLGKYPETTLAEAREKAAAQKKLSAAKIDPLAERDRVKEAHRQAEIAEKARSTPFKQIAERYIEAHRPTWKNLKHAQQWSNTLETYAYPIIGQLPTSEITTQDILKILLPIWPVKTETASRVRNRIELVLDAAKAHGLRDGENPARWRGHLDKLLPKRSKVSKVKHHTALAWQELPAFIKKLSQRKGSSYNAILLTILTATRSSETLKATWSEIDFNTQTWTIPAERMKADKAHRIPLSPKAIELLQNLPQVKGNPYIFPGLRGNKHLSSHSMLMALRDLNPPNLTMHGFRSTFRDWAAEETNHPREVCEMALAHTVAEGAEAAYWRGDIFEKRRKLMLDWEEFVTSALHNQEQLP